MADRYTKMLRTIIAAALVALVIQGLMPHAKAQLGVGCGQDMRMPCYIETSGALEVTARNPLKVVVVPY